MEMKVANDSTKLKEMTIVGIMFMFVVGVAQWLRRQVVALEIVGSNPTAHPFQLCAYSSAEQSTGLRNRGSWVRIPLGAPAKSSGFANILRSSCFPKEHIKRRNRCSRSPDITGGKASCLIGHSAIF